MNEMIRWHVAQGLWYDIHEYNVRSNTDQNRLV